MLTLDIVVCLYLFGVNGDVQCFCAIEFKMSVPEPEVRYMLRNHPVVA